VTDCAHRLAASRHIRKHLYASHREWLARRAGSESQRSSLLKLALTSLELHDKAMENNVAPWQDGKGPLAVACACLQTVRKNDGDFR
jgi:hypothetical protein